MPSGLIIPEEIDSYLYQTVGQDAIEFVAKALDVPLYRRTISGVAIQQGSEYGSREASAQSAIVGDETEDLFELLSEVKVSDSLGCLPRKLRRFCRSNILKYLGYLSERFYRIISGSEWSMCKSFDLNFVSPLKYVFCPSQRCRRLGLTALCYLWQRDQDQLLEEMINNGMEAILIKVAGIGLKPVHLGKSLSEMQMKLRELVCFPEMHYRAISYSYFILLQNRLYGAHICGEGGEYETLTLDCPLFKRRLHM